MAKQPQPQITPEEPVSTETDPRDAMIRELQAQLAKEQADKEELRLSMEKAVAEATTLKETMPTPMEAESKLVLKTGLFFNGVFHPAGSVCPFDPRNPPTGCNGLMENVHWALRKF